MASQSEMFGKQSEIIHQQSRMLEKALTSRPDAGAPHGDEQVTDKLNAITGIEFKQAMPVIKDADTNLQKLLNEFESILDCHAFGRKAVRPIDRLALFRKCFPAGSTRLQVYDTQIRRARKLGRLPAEAAAV